MFFDRITANGWTAMKRGWPDFFCISPEGEICAVEVKPKAAYHLKREQLIVAKALKAAGIKVYKWTPDGGFADPEQ